MSTAGDETGRFRQRRRTRAAIVAAATDLLRQGKQPSVADVAEAADVSRRTVYLHFPTLEQLLVDATLGALSQAAIDEAIDAADLGGNADARVTAMIDAIAATSAEALPLGRSLIRRTVDSPPNPDPAVPKRGYRRIGWIERAVEPLRDRLTPERHRQLVSALAMVIGWEALIVLQDVRSLPPDEQNETMRWAARALIAAALAESADEPDRADGAPPPS